MAAEPVIRKVEYTEQGFFAFNDTNRVYNYCGHEGPSWLSRAKMNMGPDWYYHDAPPIEYHIDSRGFRNEKEIEEISEDPNWFLFDVGCFSLAPGVHSAETMSARFTEITGYPTYNLSVIGSLTYTTNYNIMRIASEWKNPPKGIVTWMSTCPYATSYNRQGNSIRGGQGGQIMTLNHISASLIKQNPVVHKWGEYLNSGIAEWQYQTLYESQVNFAKAIGSQIYWVAGNTKENHFPGHFIEKLENLSHRENIPTVWCRTEMGENMMIDVYKTTFEEQCEFHDRYFLDTMKMAKPMEGVDHTRLGRDLIHPGPKVQSEVAQRLSELVL